MVSSKSAFVPNLELTSNSKAWEAGNREKAISTHIKQFRFLRYTGSSASKPVWLRPAELGSYAKIGTLWYFIVTNYKFSHLIKGGLLVPPSSRHLYYTLCARGSEDKLELMQSYSIQGLSLSCPCPLHCRLFFLSSASGAQTVSVCAPVLFSFFFPQSLALRLLFFFVVSRCAFLFVSAIYILCACRSGNGGVCSRIGKIAFRSKYN